MVINIIAITNYYHHTSSTDTQLARNHAARQAEPRTVADSVECWAACILGTSRWRGLVGHLLFLRQRPGVPQRSVWQRLPGGGGPIRRSGCALLFLCDLCALAATPSFAFACLLCFCFCFARWALILLCFALAAVLSFACAPFPSPPLPTLALPMGHTAPPDPESSMLIKQSWVAHYAWGQHVDWRRGLAYSYIKRNIWMYL